MSMAGLPQSGQSLARMSSSSTRIRSTPACVPSAALLCACAERGLVVRQRRVCGACWRVLECVRQEVRGGRGQKGKAVLRTQGKEESAHPFGFFRDDGCLQLAHALCTTQPPSPRNRKHAVKRETLCHIVARSHAGRVRGKASGVRGQM